MSSSNCMKHEDTTRVLHVDFFIKSNLNLYFLCDLTLKSQFLLTCLSTSILFISWSFRRWIIFYPVLIGSGCPVEGPMPSFPPPTNGSLPCKISWKIKPASTTNIRKKSDPHFSHTTVPNLTDHKPTWVVPMTLRVGLRLSLLWKNL